MPVDMLLVNPLYLRDDPVESRLMTPYFPLGILYVAAAARAAGYRVAIFDGMFETNDDAFEAVLAREQPKVVGFGVLATVRRAALRLAALAKRRGATVVMGGADPTARPETYLAHQDGGLYPVDVVTVGESEETIVELLRALLARGGDAPATEVAATASVGAIASIAAIAGLAYRDQSGQVVRTPCRDLIEDVNGIPLPARDLIDLEPYRRAWRSRHGFFSMSLIATRGCPFNCAWCQKIVFGRSYRPRAPERVAEEMRLIRERYQPDQLRIVDDVMGIDRRWVRAWHDAVLARDAAIPFECLSRVDLVDEELVQLLQEVGCRRIAFGAESGSQRVLDAMTKGTTVAQIYRTAEICRAAGIETYFYMMVGYPGEEWNDLKQSVALLRKTRPDAFSTTIAYPLPGTAFYEEVQHRLPGGGTASLDWDYTAENRLLFAAGRYNTPFYRRVIRWFHSEWRDAQIQAGMPVSTRERVRGKVGLWRDRLVVHLLARLPFLTGGGQRRQPR
ncbi:MAG: B12-binding domain-containing radical SAM protein [Anaerolineae bacterium]|nr:B12-binding domain-containing radical SAM protein [Anaerolineae bacterium]